MDKQTPHRRVHSTRVGNTKILNHSGRYLSIRDPYHFVLSLNWPQFFAGLVTIFLLMNVAFGTLYWLIPGSVANAREGVFLDYFFFSIETLATVGYGAMSPVGMGGHVIASAEILFGMVGVALTTGLVFARFAKPTARIIFSDRAIIRTFDAKRMLTLRIANERYNRIVGASATVALIRREVTAEGESYFRIYDLPLIRHSTQVFALTWTLMHPIDEASPLFALTADQLAATQSRILVSITGHDESIAAAVHAVKDYGVESLVFDGRFVDILGLDADGERVVDLTRFHDIEEANG